MTKFRKFSVALLASAMLVAGTGAATAQSAQPDLFAYSEGGRLVQYPEDVQISQMDSSPLNLIDGSATTDWTGKANPTPVFVFELAEQTELSRIVFDTAGLNRDEKAARAVTVEVSDTSATSGFETVMSVSLKMQKNNQSFAFDPEYLPVGRWVRLTVVDNYAGDDYSGFTGFRGYGRQLTATATMPDVTGSYEGHSGWGALNLKQQGDRVTGCYEYQSGRVTGSIKGRTMTLDMVQTSSDGSIEEQRGYFGISRDGEHLIGFSKGIEPAQRDSYGNYLAADRVSDRSGSCG